MLLHRGFPTTTTDRTICALSLAPSRAPYRARARVRLHEFAPTSTTRRPARSERPAEKAWGVSSHAAQPLALSRWRRGHMHLSPERRPSGAWPTAGRPLEASGEPVTREQRGSRTPGMVGRERRGGRQRRAGRARGETSFHRVRRLENQPMSWWTQKGRGRLGRSPTPQAPQERGAQRGSRERSEREQARRSLAWSRDIERPRAFEWRRRR